MPTGLQWLLTPLSGAAEHAIQPLTYWHARSMVLAWAVLFPLGALVARFHKVRPGRGWPQALDDKWWWHHHRWLQYTGCIAMLIGLGLAYRQGGGPAGGLAQWHHWLGWLVIVMAVLQVLGGLLRGSKGGPTDRQLRGDHYDMTPRRIAFEWLHKGLGWTSVLLSMVVIAMGLVVVDAPRWMPLVLALWYAVLIACFWRWHREGRCLDTYQAIWGPDPAHPGNGPRRARWGVRRA